MITTTSNQELKKKLNVMICDDHPICQMGIEMSLKELDHEYQIDFNKTSYGLRALEFVHENDTDILFLDLSLEDSCGLDIVKKIKELNIRTKVIIITSSKDYGLLKQLQNEKIAAIISKDYKSNFLQFVVDKVLKTKNIDTITCPSIKQILDKFNDHNLTRKELEVLSYISDGLTSKETADKLMCSFETIKSHRKNIMAKLRVNNRSEMIAWYLKRKG